MELRGAKERALLALLAVHVGHVVSDDRILDELWGETLPANPLNALQKRVSELRKVIGADRVVRHADGYVLNVPPDQVDATDFESRATTGRDALATGDLAGAVKLLREALAMWDGPALAELVDLPFARAEAARLEELRLTALEDRVEAELMQGGHHPIAAELAPIVAEHPLRERLRAQLMLALYRSGRQAEALRAYQDARQVLGEELGLEPGPELRDLEAAILVHDPELGLVDVRAGSGNLRPRVTSFVGRVAELRLVHELLARHRVVTLTGAGGAGKTRLAYEAAARLDNPPTGGIWVAELAPLVDGAGVAEVVAQAIGARDAGGEQPTTATARVVEDLGASRALVIVDNCEHVLDDVARLASTIITVCPNVQILATSREPLGISGEAQVAVPPLKPDEAQELFVERAAAVDPRGVSGMTGHPAVVDVCARLDGLPLAIELAAARTKTLPIEHLATRLTDRFKVLTGGSRTAMRRQQTLRATVDWSYDLLFEHERWLFRQLAVFAGGFDLRAAAAVCDGQDLEPTDVEDTVAHLVDKSLLVRDGDRYRMLETLREYAIERLLEEGEVDHARAAHAQWCDDLVARAIPGFRGADQLLWLDRLDLEHDNIRVAVDWALDADPVLALRLTAGVTEPWRLRGHRREARYLLDLALEAAGPDAPAPVRSDGLLWAGFLAGALGWAGETGTIEEELDLARQRQEEAIALARQAGDLWRAASHEKYLVMTLVRSDSYAGGIAHRRYDAELESAAEVLREHDDDWGLALTWTIQAWAALLAGDLETADRAMAHASPHVTRTGDFYTQERLHVCNAVAEELRGDPEMARAHYEHALALARELGFEDAVTSHLNRLAQLRENEAETNIDGLASEERATAAAARNRLATMALADGDLRRASALYGEALALYRRLGFDGGIASSEAGLRAVAEANLREERLDADSGHTGAP